MMFFSCGKLGEVTENIPIFAPAFRTQTQTNTQPNMRLTHNPSSKTQNLAEIHAFSSKERDTETGLSYFGARYYSSDLSIWLSVDPMADKYPSLSPYVYCANNPVKLVDPNGMQWETPEDESIANDLITSAEKKIKSNNKLITSASEDLKKQKLTLVHDKNLKHLAIYL